MSAVKLVLLRVFRLCVSACVRVHLRVVLQPLFLHTSTCAVIQYINNETLVCIVLLYLQPVDGKICLVKYYANT